VAMPPFLKVCVDKTEKFHIFLSYFSK